MPGCQTRRSTCLAGTFRSTTAPRHSPGAISPLRSPRRSSDMSTWKTVAERGSTGSPFASAPAGARCGSAACSSANGPTRARARVGPFAEEHAAEPHLAPAGADANGDPVEPLSATVFHVDISLERLGDRSGEIAPGECLGAVVERKVPARHVDRLVWHPGIVTLVVWTNYTWEYT